MPLAEHFALTNSSGIDKHSLLLTRHYPLHFETGRSRSTMVAIGSFAKFTSVARCHPRYRSGTIFSDNSQSFPSCFPKGIRELGASMNSRAGAHCHARILSARKSRLVAARSSKQIAKLGEIELKTDNCVNVEITLPTDSDRLMSGSTAESVCCTGHESSEQAQLPNGLDVRFLPNHVAIIMDGNSRWAERRGLSSCVGHEAGVRALKEVVRLSLMWGIRALTVFGFSIENWHRPEEEVSFLMQLFQKVLREELETLVKENIQVRIIGDIRQLSVPFQELINEVENITRQNSGLKLTVAVGYSGRNDIVQACQQIASKIQKGELRPEDITESLVDNELGTSWMGDARNPDLLIRTSGEQRLSNFLLWQLAYTELFFLDVCWPEVDEAQYASALLSYQRRNRRYGKRSSTQGLLPRL